MAKRKDIFKRGSFVRFALIATAVLLVFFLLKKDNLFRWIQAGFTISRQERQIEWLKNDNARLDREIRLMSTDRDTLEKFAREQFNFAEDGDDVYIEQ